YSAPHSPESDIQVYLAAALAAVADLGLFIQSDSAGYLGYWHGCVGGFDRAAGTDRLAVQAARARLFLRRVLFPVARADVQLVVDHRQHHGRTFPLSALNWFCRLSGRRGSGAVWKTRNEDFSP